MNYLKKEDGFYSIQTQEKTTEQFKFCFINDVVDEKGTIISSPTRIQKYHTGILDLSRTYGKKNKKMIYICYPNNKQLPFFYISYQPPYQFDKSIKQLYVTFSFESWTLEFPNGTLLQNLGSIHKPINYFEYLLYCNQLKCPLHNFNKYIKKNINFTEDYDLEEINDTIITIDKNTTYLYDDAISISNKKIRVYITCVPFILESFGLWNFLEKIRPSAIYLPDNRVSMLPEMLSTILSLTENKTRPCIMFEFENDEIITIKIVKIKVKKNNSYYDETFLHSEILNKLRIVSNKKNPIDMIKHYMEKINYYVGKRLSKGIYLSIKKRNKIVPETIWKEFTSCYDTQGDYLQITSPIRRIADIINMYLFCKELKLTPLQNGDKLCETTITNIEDLNIKMKAIKKIQKNTLLLHDAYKNHQQVYSGIPIEKANVLKNNASKNKYNIYITQLSIMVSFVSSEELTLDQQYNFQLFVFFEKKQKIKIQKVDQK